MSEKIIAVVGPTASGKTALSIELCKALGGEIVSCDSMQIYKNMNIGTAKPTEEEKCGIPHHLIDITDRNCCFSCADYKPLAEQAVAEIIGRGNVPIFCGGTGLYLDSVISVSGFSPSIPESVREELKLMTPNQLWNELCAVDPEAAQKTHINNVKRVMRALEIYRGTGKTKTEWDRLSKLSPPPYDSLIIGLDYRDRSVLYERIGKRVDIMLENGLVEEVKGLCLNRASTAAQAIGYKEILMYLDGTLPYGEAVELLKKNTRNYAKRQLTWFKRSSDVCWLYPDEESADSLISKAVMLAKDFLNK